jgi:hypothetical protein
MSSLFLLLEALSGSEIWSKVKLVRFTPVLIRFACLEILV